MAETLPDIISFSGVGKSFAQRGATVEATRDVNVCLREGEIVTIVGPSGCGKTTVLNMVAGLLKPTTGRVCYRGHEITGINGRTGYMTQSDHLLPWRDVASNIAVPLEIREVPKAERVGRVQELIALVGLTHFEHAYPARLSGGMRKRAALARVLAYDPETLLLDEPFAALDAQLRVRMQMELHAVSRRLKKTVLFVTHDLDEAVALGDRVLVFSARPGTIVRDIRVPLPANRNIVALRTDDTYRRVCGELWELVAPDLSAAEPAS